MGLPGESHYVDYHTVVYFIRALVTSGADHAFSFDGKREAEHVCDGAKLLPLLFWVVGNVGT